MEELKPCPFCGGKAELIIVPGYFKQGLSSSGWLVKCLNGCVNQMPFMSNHDAIEAWNRRRMMTNEIDRIESAIRHIKTSVDVDPWAMEIAVEAMEKQVPKMPVEGYIFREGFRSLKNSTLISGFTA